MSRWELIRITPINFTAKRLTRRIRAALCNYPITIHALRVQECERG